MMAPTITTTKKIPQTIPALKMPPTTSHDENKRRMLSSENNVYFFIIRIVLWNISNFVPPILQV